MESTLARPSTPFCPFKPYTKVALPPRLQPPLSPHPSKFKFLLTSRKLHPSDGIIRATSSSHNPAPISSPQQKHPIGLTLRNAAKAMVLTAAAALLIAKYNKMPAKAESSIPLAEISDLDDAKEKGTEVENRSSLTHLLESKSEFTESLKSALQQRLENGEDEEALKILHKLVAAQPKEAEWKFLMARVLTDMGNAKDARKVFEEILELNPLSFEALFENALLMDRCGERDEVMGRLENALRIAEEENKAKEARDVRLIIAQMQFLQKNIDGALKSYEELVKEDPKDFRPYFCKGMIYSLQDRNAEAREQFAKYRELSPKKFAVEGYLRTSLSRMKLFGESDAGN